MGSRRRAVRGLCRRPRSPRRNAWQAAGDRGVRLPPRRRDLCPRHVDDLARPLLRDDPEPGRGVVAGRRIGRAVGWERVSRYVEVWGDVGLLTTKKKEHRYNNITHTVLYK